MLLIFAGLMKNLGEIRKYKLSENEIHFFQQFFLSLQKIDEDAI